MAESRKLKFFNLFRNLIRIFRLDFLFPILTNNKGYENILVKCIPQNYQYPKGSFRKVKRNGIWFELDISEYMEWVIYFGLSVENRNELYRLVSERMILFDIGSNIGETLLNFAQLTGKKGKVYGFEPVPFTYDKCVNNVSLNSYENVLLEQIALSNKKETLFFHDSNNNNSGGVYMNKNKAPGSHTVQAITLDEYVASNEIKKIDLIKDINISINNIY